MPLGIDEDVDQLEREIENVLMRNTRVSNEALRPGFEPNIVNMTTSNFNRGAQ